MTGRRRRAVTVAAAAVGLALVGCAAWIGVRGWMAQGELERAHALTGEIRDAATAGDVASALALAERAAAHVGAAAALTSDPVWRAAEWIPAAGPNLVAVRVTSSSLDTIVSDSVVPMLGGAEALVADIRRDDGGLDTDAVASQHSPLHEAHAALRAASGDLGRVDAAALLAPIREGLLEVESAVAQLLPVAAALDGATQLIPAMLGGDGERTILVMLQNNAELRTGGGISGSFIELRADAGRLTLVSQADSAQFDETDSPVLDIPESTLALHGTQVGRFVQNATMPADFDLTARLASRWWGKISASTPDAVVSVDPLVLRAVLEATGPISAGNGTLSADGLVQRLLVDPYMSLASDDQTRLFRETAAVVFTELADFDIDPLGLAAALTTPISEGRISVWSAHDEEQDLLSGTALAGPAARQRAAGDAAFALYLNDATGGKMDTLLDVSVALGTGACRPDGRRDVVVALTLTSEASADAGRALPAAMTGGGRYGTAAGSIATNVAVSAPEGSFFGGVTEGGQQVASVDVEDAGFPVSATRVVVRPGESKTVQFRFGAAEAGAITPELLHTPMVDPVTVSPTSVECG